MPFYGIPSKACGECRKKRRRCDLLKPSCSSCIRAKIICPGYRSSSDVTFRDETLAVARRHGQDCQTEEAEKPTADDRVAKVKRHHVLAMTKKPQGYFVLDSVAASFFFDRYVVDSGSPRVDTGFLLEIYQASTHDDMLQASINAIGMFLSSFQAHNRIGIGRAFQKYASALRLTHVALSNPININVEVVLATTLLLGLFETVTCFRIHFWEAAAMHMDGAISLLRLIGSNLLRTHTGRRLFHTLRGQILLSAYLRKEPFPDIVDSLSAACARFSPNPDEVHANKLGDLSSRYLGIRARMYNGVLSSDEALHLLGQLTKDLSSWSASVPAAYKIERLSATNDSHAYGKYINRYTNHWITETWSTYHSVWLMTCDAKIHALKSKKVIESGALPDLETEPIREIIASEEEHRDEICASVPYLVQYPRFMRSGNTATNMAVYSPLTVCWPLWDAACSERTPPALRNWAIEILDNLERQTGLRLAGATVWALRDRLPGPH